jgi:hypothetical protein
MNIMEIKNELPPVIFRDAVNTIIPGLSPRTLANEDCKGFGPKNRFRIGRKIAYFRTDFLEYLESKVQKVESKRNFPGRN